MIIGLFNTLIFIILIAMYIALSRILMSSFSNIELVLALTVSGLGIVFIATHVFHVAVDAFRRMKKLDKETSRGLEICA